MRKIEAQMNQAILDKINWQSANTKVSYSPENDASYIFLHNNHIATVGDNYVEIFSRGHKTATTKNRLNAILREHGIDGECIFQRNFNWYVNKYAGQLGTSPIFIEKEFEEGMILS